MMTKPFSPIAAAVISLFLLPGISIAQDNNANLLGQINTITTAVPFLIISPDARAGGMGDAGAGSYADANSIHWNPSKLAFVEKKLGFAVSYTPWLRQLVPDINLAYVSFYDKLKGDQTIGASLRYFSLGNITFTDNAGNEIGQFNPNEYAFDIAYARKLSENFSGGIALRYVYSNLTGGILVENNATKPGQAVAADISATYHNSDLEIGGKDATLNVGLVISNIGNKISYTETGTKDFIPINLRLGPALTLKLNDYNELTFLVDFNKLMVPTPPIYSDSMSNGQQQILYGSDPDVSVPEGMIKSFSDAPDGFSEEMKEINIASGFEYWYDKQFAFRAGYFYEHEDKGNRKYFTLGAGLKYNVFGLDFAYLIPTDQRNPLENTLRFTLLFDFNSLKKADDE